MSREQILIVEDDAITANHMAVVLKSIGYETCGISVSGEDAIERAGFYNPDLVLMDISLLGKLNGLEAAREIRDRFSIPVVYLTSHSESAILQQAKATDPYGYVTKPFHERDLQIAVELALHKHSIERELKGREARLSALFDFAPDAYFLTSMEGILIDANRATVELSGCKKEDLMGKSFMELGMLQPEMIPGVAAMLELNKQGCPAGPDEIMVNRIDGALTHIEVKTYPIQVKSQTLVLGIARDITDSRRTREALRDSESQLTTFLESTSDGLLIADEETRQFTYANPAICKMFGYTEEEFRKMHIRDIHPEGELEYVLSRFEAQARGEKAIIEAIPCMRKDGTVFYADINAVKTTIGERACMMRFFRDITERINTEKALREKESTLRSVFLAAPIGIGLAINRVIMQANARLCEMTGYSEEELLGQNARMLYLSDEDFEYVGREKYAQIRAKGTGTVETRFRRKDGTVIDILISSTPLDQKDLQAGVIFTALDITGQKSRDCIIAIQRDLGIALSATSSLSETMSRSLDAALQVQGVDSGGIYLVDQQTGEITLAAHRGLTQPFIELVSWYGSDSENSHMIREGEVIYLPHPVEFPGMNEKLREEGLRSLVIIPIRHGDRVIASFHIASHQYDEIPQETCNALESIATQIGDTIARVQAEAALRESEENFRMLAESLPQTIFELDSRGGLTYTNQSAYDIFGYTREEFQDRPDVFQMVAPEDHDRIRVNMGKSLEKQKSSNEYTAIRKDGSTFPAIVYTSPIIRDGKPEGLRGMLVDITEQKSSEERIKTSLREKEVLLREIHHRVKNNMQVISSILHLQSRHSKDPAHQELICGCRNRIRSMALVHEKLYESPDMSHIDFAIYLRSIISYLIQTYQRSDISFSLESDRIFLDVDTAVPCGLIVNELASNAVKHAFPNGKRGILNISLRNPRENEITLIIEDNGIGLPAHLNFSNVSTLGLQLVNDLVEQLNGTIELSRDKGTAFTITFLSKEQGFQDACQRFRHEAETRR